ncbi:MAG: hypothetical protein WC859_07995 [Elusimicrobiota bacterium]
MPDSENPNRRNPFRLIVTKETQLRVLWLVGVSIFFSMAVAVTLAFCMEEWIWAVAVGLAIGAFVSLWVSRSIAGPYYRIEKDLEVLLSGAASGKMIRLRPDDPLQHLANLINVLIERTHSAP